MKEEAIEFEVDGLRLRGNIYIPESPKSLAVLFLHGWTGRPNDSAADVLAASGYSCMTFSLRGHNDSEGRLEDVTRAGSLKDAVASYDFFKTQLPKETKIVVIGSSYGSYLATILTKQREVAALSLRVPANYPDEHFEDPQLPQAPDQSNTFLTEWRKQIIKYDQSMSLRSLHEFSGPVQIIEAEEDEIVPYQTVQNYVDVIKDKSKLDYHLMPGWPHSLGDDPKRNEDYQSILLTWLKKISERL